MRRFAEWIQAFALGLGAPGLFIVAFLDSSFLSLPEINDILLIWMVTEHKARMPVYALASTLGSIAGCVVLYYVGLKGGDALVRRRFHADRVDRALGVIQRNGVLAVLIPSLLPPPAPFKIFVLLAGVAGIPISRFILAIGIGRGIRYFGEGLLAIRYGDRAIAYLENNFRIVSLALVGLVVVGVAGYLLWAKARRGQSR
jgi:membrane protein YqaA with SNARE-associated domain